MCQGVLYTSSRQYELIIHKNVNQYNELTLIFYLYFIFNISSSKFHTTLNIGSNIAYIRRERKIGSKMTKSWLEDTLLQPPLHCRLTPPQNVPLTWAAS